MRNKELKDFIYKNVYQNTSTGYVLTPSELAYEMISTLPESVFKSETTTFLDPICKSGTFLFEIVEKLYDEGHSIGNIQSRLFTIDDNSHSLNVANGYIKKILNKLSGTFKVDYKSEFIERYYNRLIINISKGKYTTFDDFLSIIMVDKTNIELMKELQKNISEFIGQYEKVSKLESKLFGEVFTPRKLIDEMLDTLPKEVWSNPDLKWLDPAVGIGNFPAAILDRLMVGLSDEFKDELDRKKHILEEMLYFCDISTKNLFLLYMLFDKNNEFELNVYRGSFLTEEFNKHMKNVWKLEGFDVVVGNPPYNDESTSTGDNKLYLQFIEKSFNRYLLKDKYLLFVTPKKSIENLTDLSKNRNYIGEHKKVLFLSLDTPSRYFKVGSSFCYFLIQNTMDDGSKFKIEFIDRNNKIDSIESNIYKWKKVPKYLDRLTISILEKTIFLSGERFSFKTMKRLNFTNFRIRKKQIENGSVSITENEEYKFKFIDKIKASGTTEYFIKESMIESELKKVIISQGGSYPFPFYDNGEYSCSDNIRYLIVNNEEEGILMVDFIKSKIIKFLEECLTKGIDMDFSYSILNILKIDFKNMKSLNDIYQYYKLTQEEIDLIEKTIKD
jgi:hypothetical protein